ncbi:hypothetical protein PsorP6_006858 [Peronosclerospora sorghi]|uniref:Uncharacterized protein n=1 Tax=Peronosclerospora sorghi TaxID=230839 RepID=A0ACC0WA31_9STRA|nr:hypothetical protein PsorP6_006858 [Peronosclerospora sorghi]
MQIILRQLAADGFTNIVWINLREEAVIYVRGKPFTARRSARLNENDLVPGITGHKVQILESSLKQSLQQALGAAAHRFEYSNEVAPGENDLVVAQAAPDDVVTLPALCETLNDRACLLQDKAGVNPRTPGASNVPDSTSGVAGNDTMMTANAPPGIAMNSGASSMGPHGHVVGNMPYGNRMLQQQLMQQQHLQMQNTAKHTDAAAARSATAAAIPRSSTL